MNTETFMETCTFTPPAFESSAQCRAAVQSDMCEEIIIANSVKNGGTGCSAENVKKYCKNLNSTSMQAQFICASIPVAQKNGNFKTAVATYNDTVVNSNHELLIEIQDPY